jgi:hypothetical protein
MLCGRDSGNKKEEKVEKNARFYLKGEKKRQIINERRRRHSEKGRKASSIAIDRSIDR